MVSDEQFLESLRGALKHLYDPSTLRRSPLIGWFGLQNQPDSIPALQNILTSAIEGLEPNIGSPNSAQRQKTFDLLMYRYVQQFSQEEVASHLGMSVRHLRREQNDATFLLAGELWKQYHLSDRAFDPPQTPDGEGDFEPGLEGAAAQEPQAAELPDSPKEGIQNPAKDDELAFLRVSSPDDQVIVESFLPAALDLVRPLAQRHASPFRLTIEPHLPQVAAKPAALRQLILTILSIAIPRAPGKEVAVSAEIDQGLVCLQVGCIPEKTSSLPESQTEKENLEMAYRLAEICGAKLKVSLDEKSFLAALTLPVRPQYNILIIDDNPDNVHLIQHFAAGTRYRLTGTQDPMQALDRVEQEQPNLVILDVMMPDLDGWELLGRLRNHPHTGHIPVIVCTILSQEEMALTLGASGFIHKPLTRQNLLSELDRQVELLEKEPR